MSLILSELKTLHDKGLALIYLRPKTKRPFEDRWTSLKPKSWDELQNSFEKSYNVGVRLGEPSKLKSGNYLGAIDCDVKSTSRKHLKEMRAKLRELGIDLDSAPIVMSGRGNGSRHIYVQTKEPMLPRSFFKSPEMVKVKMPGETRPHSKREMKELTEVERVSHYRIRPAWEISFMGTGQQTVLPPSVHPDTGFKYDWASPLTIKHCPVFNPKKWVTQNKSTHEPTAENNFKALEVDLYSSKLDLRTVRQIVDGAGVEDRSATLMSVTMKMCRLGFSDNEILSVLSDENNWLSSAAFDHTQSRSRDRAVKWLSKYTLSKARFETHPLRIFESAKDYTKLPRLDVKKAKKLQGEMNETLPDIDGNGKPKSTLRNVLHILNHFMGGGLVGFNEFSCRPYFLKNTVYGGRKGLELTDKDDLALKYYLAQHYRFEPSKETCFEAHTLLSHQHSWHPVKAYLEPLEWDGVPRLESWLRNAFQATGPSSYLSAVGKKVLCAAVARVYHPGCKFDYVMVLEGSQGEGKSMSLAILAGQDWFTDGLGDIHNKDVVDQMTGKWVVEIAELAAIKGRENEAIKSFLSRQVDRVRISYGRRSQDYPRQSIFIGSTNAKEYFTDETGNRRYWPVSVGRANRKWLRAHRDQLWAEAKYRYELGEKLYLDEELERIARREQEKRFDVDEWEDEIKKIIAKGGKEESYKTIEIYQALSMSNGQPSQFDMRRIGRIMIRLGLTRTVRVFDGVRGKCWVKHV